MIAWSSVLDAVLDRPQLAAARAREQGPAGRALARATDARLAIDRIRSSAYPLPHHGGARLVLPLVEEALYWSLVAHQEPAEPLPWPDLLAASTELLASLDLAPSALDDLLATLRLGLAERADLDPRDTDLVVERALGLVDRLLARAPLSLDGSLKLRAWTWLRLLALVVVVVALITSVVLGVRRWRLGPDLAAGKIGRASSQAFDCHPQVHECGGSRTDILFHTREEDNPWFELNLGAPVSFSTVIVDNRRDCCAERAAPLVLEVSDDGKTWRQVARRDDPFSTWQVRFPATTARLVRARVDRRSILHLERLGVYR